MDIVIALITVTAILLAGVGTYVTRVRLIALRKYAFRQGRTDAMVGNPSNGSYRIRSMRQSYRKGYMAGLNF